MYIKHSLVVPCFNEEGNVEKFAKRVMEVMAGYTSSYEIIYVNDGSHDFTMQKLLNIFDTYYDIKIKIIDFSRNFGKEAAIYAGLTHADGDYITIIDADLQQDPQYAVEMGKILDDNPDCDMVAAYQEKREEGKITTFCKSMFYKIISKMSKIDFIADASDFRTMRRSVANTIVNMSEYHRFSKGIFSWIGYHTIAIPYSVQERASGESKWNFKKLFKYAIDGIVAYTDAPLKLPLYVGSFTGIGSIILAVVALIININTQNVTTTFYLVSLILFLFSVLSIFIGILGYYLGKTHSQTKNRPIYIARKICSYEKE